jgi:hypothetical protein
MPGSERSNESDVLVASGAKIIDLLNYVNLITKYSGAVLNAGSGWLFHMLTALRDE